MKRNSRGLRYLVVAVVALLVIAPAAGVAVPSPPHEVYGNVTDQNGDAVEDVTVTVTDENGNSHTATTDADGYYEVKYPAEDGEKDETLTIEVKDSSKKTSFESGSTERIDISVNVSDDDDEDDDDDDNDDDGGNDDGSNTGGNTGGSTGGGAPPADQSGSGSANLGATGSAIVDLGSESSVSNVELSIPGASGEVSVEEVTDLPAGTPETTYKRIATVDISAPDPTDGSATVKLTVSQSRVADADADPENLVVEHYDGDSWEELETSVSESGDNYVIETQTDGFSMFAVTDSSQQTSDAGTDTAEPGTDEPGTDEPSTDTTDPSTETPEPEDGPGALLIGGIVVVLAALAAALYMTYGRE